MEGKAFSDQSNEREKKILQRLSAGLSDQEIAHELFLSLSTVKWYNRQIYSKLAVRNRTQAIAQARALGLIDTQDISTSPSFRPNLPPILDHRKAEQRVYFTNSFDGTRIAFAFARSCPPLVNVSNDMRHM